MISIMLAVTYLVWLNNSIVAVLILWGWCCIPWWNFHVGVNHTIWVSTLVVTIFHTMRVAIPIMIVRVRTYWSSILCVIFGSGIFMDAVMVAPVTVKFVVCSVTTAVSVILSSIPHSVVNMVSVSISVGASRIVIVFYIITTSSCQWTCDCRRKSIVSTLVRVPGRAMTWTWYRGRWTKRNSISIIWAC